MTWSDLTALPSGAMITDGYVVAELGDVLPRCNPPMRAAYFVGDLSTVSGSRATAIRSDEAWMWSTREAT